MIADSLYAYMGEMLRNMTATFKRYMYERINWDNRMTGITGPRGIGKTTMLLQHIAENRHNGSRLFVSADHTYFSNHSLSGLADDFVKEGGTHLYIDEIHKYRDWSRELKQIYDVHPQLHVVFTGSSVLDIKKGEADLSRRALMYHMQGLSFREYLGMSHNVEVKPFSLEDILNHEVTIPDLAHPLPLFREYLRKGYYPFSADFGFEMRMEQIIAQTVESDIALYADMKASTARKLKQMLSVISTLAPFKPSMESLANEIGVSKNNVPDYLVVLERAGMIGTLRDDTGGLRGLGKIEKVYIDNPSLEYALSGGKPNVGNTRETFFYNQMRVGNSVRASKKTDFVIGEHSFEIGGKSKGGSQLENDPNGIIVKDDIEYGHGHVLPLWQFGLNY